MNDPHFDHDGVYVGRVVVYSQHADVSRTVLSPLLGDRFHVQVAGSLTEASRLLAQGGCDVCLVDSVGRECAATPNESCSEVPEPSAAVRETLDVLRAASAESGRGTQVLVLADAPRLEAGGGSGMLGPQGHDDTAVFGWPWIANSLRSVVSTAVELSRVRAQTQRLRWQLANESLRAVLGHSGPMHTLCAEIQQAADDERRVLVCGEPGTGLGLVARAIHDGGGWARSTFTSLNCRLLASAECERQLFADDGGPTFHMAEPTGPHRAGTLFLDDVDALSLPLQARLVRTLESELAETSSGSRRVRLIAASHADLPSLATQGRFRSDLLQALSAMTLRTPPLRQHREDIPLLAERFLERLALEDGFARKRLTAEALAILGDYDWPNNVRELHNTLRSAALLSEEPELTAETIRPWLTAAPEREQDAAPVLSLRDMEQKLIEATFARCGGNRERTAKALRIGVRTLSGKLRQYGYPPRGGPGSNAKAA